MFHYNSDHGSQSILKTKFPDLTYKYVRSDTPCYAIFTARRYASAFVVVRCLSVRLSVTLVDCMTAEDIVKLLSRPVYLF